MNSTALNLAHFEDSSSTIAAPISPKVKLTASLDKKVDFGWYCLCASVRKISTYL